MRKLLLAALLIFPGLAYADFVDYDTFKVCVTSKSLDWQYIERADWYEIFTFDGNIKYETRVYKSSDNVAGLDWDTEETYKTDFEGVYKSSANKPTGIKLNPYAVGSVEFQGVGKSTTVTAGDTQNLDLKVTSGDRLFNGGMLYTTNAVIGDWIKVQIVDVDNILGYGSDYVVKTFIQKYYVFPGHVMTVKTPYAGKVLENLYIRMQYKSTGGTNVGLAVNYFLTQAI